MTRLVKKAAAAKNIPLLALALFAAVFMGSKVLAMVNSSSMAPSPWEFDTTITSPDPTNPDHYAPYSGNLATDCVQVAEICGIIAEEDPQNPGKPLITDELRDRIEAEDTSEGDVFLRPMQ